MNTLFTLEGFRFSKKVVAELTGLQSIIKAKEETYNTEVSELRSKGDCLRLELVNLTRKVDRLSEEKNGYRAQVQDMNMALKNSLEHIKRLRTSAIQLKAESNGQDWNDFLLLSTISQKIPSSTTAVVTESCKNGLKSEDENNKQNLVSLQSCLASLKYEMAVLQKKLAPSATSSPIKCKTTKALLHKELENEDQ